MTKVSVIKHGTCSVCQKDKTVTIYREDDLLLPPICEECELKGAKTKRKSS